MTKRPPEADEVYYARLRAFEPARRLKLDADVASNNDPDRLALVEEPKRSQLAAKYAKAALALRPSASEDAAASGQTDRPAFVLLTKYNPFAAANALRALGGAPPLPHEVSTLTENREDMLVYFAECTCRWRGPERLDEDTAGSDRLGHAEENQPEGI